MTFGFGFEPPETPKLPHEQPAVGCSAQRLAWLSEEMRHRGFDQVEVAIIFTALLESMHVKIRQVVLSLKMFFP